MNASKRQCLLPLRNSGKCSGNMLSNADWRNKKNIYMLNCSHWWAISVLDNKIKNCNLSKWLTVLAKLKTRPHLFKEAANQTLLWDYIDESKLPERYYNNLPGNILPKLWKNQVLAKKIPETDRTLGSDSTLVFAVVDTNLHYDGPGAIRGAAGSLSVHGVPVVPAGTACRHCLLQVRRDWPRVTTH